VKTEQTTREHLKNFEETLGYAFSDPNLLSRALTHRSWAHEQVSPGQEEIARQLHNESLEFLGDSVLGLVVADFLFRAHPTVTEGELSRMKHTIVSAKTLCVAAERIQLGDLLRVGRGEEKTGGRRKSALLADLYEAVLGAIYLDGGLEAAQRFITTTLGDELEKVNPLIAAAADAKTLLQETLQAAHKPGPRYEVIETEGPPHRRTFHVEVRWEGGSARSKGRTIKAAETSAARKALSELQNVAASEEISE
jgi:ribonuclease III